jgi:hypothetical protein
MYTSLIFFIFRKFQIEKHINDQLSKQPQEVRPSEVVVVNNNNNNNNNKSENSQASHQVPML